MAKHNELGKWGEELACETLFMADYVILERNWRMGHFEVDLIARKGERIVFVEVKTRVDKDLDPLDAIDNRKIKHLVASAEAYMQKVGEQHEAQFDVIGICGTPDDYRIEHIPDAFYPPLTSY